VKNDEFRAWCDAIIAEANKKPLGPPVVPTRDNNCEGPSLAVTQSQDYKNSARNRRTSFKYRSTSESRIEIGDKAFERYYYTHLASTE
jgi:hypothetical protein